MSTRFLPREIGSIDTGPQIFAGTQDPNTTISFAETLGLLNSVKVEGAAQVSLNGTFVYIADFNNRPYYNKDNNGNLFIVYNNFTWEIYDFSVSEDPLYYSNNTNANYPWNATSWSVSNIIYNPVPSVTKIL